MSENGTDDRITMLESRISKLEEALASQCKNIPAKKIMPVHKQMLNMTEAAEFLGLEVAGLRMLTHKKLIPYYKPNGKTCYFDPKELKKWQQRKRQKPVYENDSHDISESEN